MQIFKRLILGILLLAAASASLLIVVWAENRKKGDLQKVAILQHTSVTALDDSAHGVLDELKDSGYENGKNIILDLKNANGDMATANGLAKQMTEGNYDLLVTISTLSLQTVANANKERKRRHVFGISADPPGAGVGINRDNLADHPPWMTGQGILLPVDESFKIARQCFPNFTRVGIAWNPNESNAVCFAEMAQKVCKDMNIEVEAREVSSSAEVVSRLENMCASNIQAIWVGGDVMLTQAMDSVIQVARKYKIPVISIVPGKPERGTLFDIGVDFYKAGREEGKLVVRVLRGADPKDIPVEDVLSRVPRLLVVNEKALENLKDPWSIPGTVIDKAQVHVDKAGKVHQKKVPAK